ncbi:MAG: chromate resistance protein [Thermodesulfobacteriota bacterium]|nr:chromate resistance protein [Thermodesulfobacteriota bacterium]
MTYQKNSDEMVFVMWMKKISVVIILFLTASDLYSQGSVHIYSTGSIMEIDRCASAWLIKKFVDKKAVFKFFPDGEIIEVGIPFDTPDAELSRTHRRSTFEVIMDTYQIVDHRLETLKKNIHDIEINFWGKKGSAESTIFAADVNKIINQAKNNDDCLEKCFIYLDKMIENRDLSQKIKVK